MFNEKIRLIYFIRISIFWGRLSVISVWFCFGILKSFKKKSRLNFPFYSFIFLTSIILKPVLGPANCEPQSQLRKYFTNDFFNRGSRSMWQFPRFISLLSRLLSYHHWIEIQNLLLNRFYLVIYNSSFLTESHSYKLWGKDLTKWCYMYRYFWWSVNLFESEYPYDEIESISK